MLTFHALRNHLMANSFRNQFLLLLALGLAALGQYYFLRRTDYFWDGAIFYTLAAIAFYARLRRQARSSEQLMIMSNNEQPAAYHPLPTAHRLLPAFGWPWQPWALGLGLVFGVEAMLGSATAGTTRATGQVPFGLWLASLALVTVALVRPVHLQALARLRSRLELHQTELVILGGITLAALALRVVALSTAPYTLSGYEGSIGLEVRAALEGELTNRFTLGWGALPTMAYWVLGWPVTFFGPQLWAFRLMPALFGAFSIPATYGLARLLFDRQVALVAALFLLGQHTSLHFSRILSVQITDTFWVALTLTLLVWGLRSGDRLLWLLSGFAVGASSYFYQGARIILVIIGLYLLYLWATQTRRHRGPQGSLNGLRASIVYLLLGTFLVAGPLWLVQLRQPAGFGPRLYEVSALDSQWLAAEKQRTGASTVGVLLNEQVVKSIEALVILPDEGDIYGGALPILDYVSGLFFVLGLVYAFLQLLGGGDHERHPYLLVQLGLWVPLFLISVLTAGVPNTGRFVIVLPCVAILVGIGVTQVVGLIEKAAGITPFSSSPPLIGERWAIGLIAAILALVNVNYYFRDYIPQGTYASLNSQVATAIGRYLHDQRAGIRAYFFGPPRIYGGSEIIRFLAWGVEVTDVPPNGQLPPLPAEQNVVFIALPERQSELAAVQQRYPGGLMRTFWSPYQASASDPALVAQPLFVSYRVSHDQ